MKINIVCSDVGWIYDQFINAFEKYSNHTILRNSKDKCDVTHYIPYYDVPASPLHPSTTWLSHRETGNPLRDKFLSSAKSVDVAISHSQKYAKFLREQGLDNVMQIIPGVDLDKFKLRQPKGARGKLVAGYIGRQYTSSSRKNPSLLKKISKLNYVELRTTGGKLSLDQIPKFYAGLDVVVSPATVEGGPMAVQEALAVGVPIVCLKGVGVADEFKLGVLSAGSPKEFMSVLKGMHKTKSHVTHWAKPEIMEQMRAQVEKQTWKKFVHEHDKVWEMITTKAWKNS